jgi:tyrosine-protein phosphatase YwqE
VLSWFRKKETEAGPPLTVDLHSHLLPGLDDGVKSYDESVSIIQAFVRLGYTTIITTPHVMSDAYRNTPEGILSSLEILRHRLREQNIPVKIRAAAEYYLDEHLMKMVNDDQTLLTIHGKYLLFETNFLTEPLNLKEFIFLATTKGFKLILAHPERYLYLQQDLAKAEDLLNRGVLFQVNISSLTGYYSKPAQQTAEKLIDHGWVHWLASDCHQMQHVKLIEEARRLKYFKKALTLPLLNNSIQ